MKNLVESGVTPDVEVVAVTPDEPERVVSPEPTPPTPESVETALGLERAERRQIQMGLASLGFDPGPADGLFGQRTREALGKWQSSQSKERTGHLDAEAAQVLLAAGEDEARKGATVQPGRVFRDCPECPEMVVVPAGSFVMGSPSWEEGRYDHEGPQHRVAFSTPFAVGRYEITREEFSQFVDATGYSAADGCWVIQNDEWKERAGRNWRNPGYRQGRRDPVVCVDWDDANAYVSWLSQTTGEHYRLLSEAEWEYAARAGVNISNYWSDGAESEACRYANVADISLGELYPEWQLPSHVCDDGYAYTSPVGTYLPNRFGLFDMLGNVGELVEDCWNSTYSGSPSDGSAWTLGDCSKRVWRASSWSYLPSSVRFALRAGDEKAVRWSNDGFRIARTLTP